MKNTQVVSLGGNQYDVTIVGTEAGVLDSFHKMGRDEKFTGNKKAVFDSLCEYEESAGERVDLEVFALCMDFLSTPVDNRVSCESCGSRYHYCDEPAEVQEGGVHICADCWNE